MSKQRVKKFLAFGLIFAFCFLILACSPRTDAPSSEDANAGEEAPLETEAVDFVWSAEKDCSTCHAKSVTSLAGLNCEAAQGDPSTTCMICHTDTEGVAAAHEDVTLADTAGDSNGLKRSKVSENACISCHDKDELIVATANVTDLTDENGFIANPHAVTTEYNVGDAHSSISCSTCHKMHSEEPVAKTADLYCRSCHHKSVYECYTCHD